MRRISVHIAFSQWLPHTWQKKLKRIALISSTILLLLLISGALGGAWFVHRSLPQTAGMLTIGGLQHQVSVERDQWGVPHIASSSLYDLIFSQGYVTAQDRLFQMELSRHIAQGRLAEIFGTGDNNEFVDADTLLRTLGIYHIAQYQAANTDTPTRNLLQAYADGVNAFLVTHKENLPLEFTLLGITPAPWTPTDDLAVAANIALSLDSTWYDKYTRALLQMKVGKDIADALFPSYPVENPTLLALPYHTATLKPILHLPLPTPNVVAFSTDFQRGMKTVRTLLANTGTSLGSNSWVVDGTRTVSGKPLLANDPHLNISMPATWYEIALQSPRQDIVGFSLPGTPGVLIGHNDHIAWGITNVEADNTDLYVEKLDPVHHVGQYRYDNRWLPLQTHQEIIYIRDKSKPLVITVAATNNGPILNDAVSDLKGFAPISLKWTLLQSSYTLAGFIQLDFATNWTQFLTALASISINQNFVYADIEGNIGYRMSGMLPVRPLANSLFPVDGSTSAYEWQGYVSQERMPKLFNPPSHVIITANNQITSKDYPFYVSAYWDYGYRAQRISDLLAMTSYLSITDFEHIQSDVYSIPASKITSFLIVAGQAVLGDAANSAKILKSWKYSMNYDSTPASLYEVATGILLREILEPLLGKDLYNIYSSNYSSSGLFTFLINILTKPTLPFFGGTNQGQNEKRRDAAITHALLDATRQLRTQLGSNPAQWQWGKLHQAHFQHPLASVNLLNFIFDVAPLERSGDSVTVNIGGDDGFSSDPPTYSQTTVSSMREIIDLSNFDSSLWIITTGESGQPFSDHYNDLTILWNKNEYQRMNFCLQAVKQTNRELLQLQPS